jgi:ABC-type uncharacterized transport system involved in gliding motility auxiliary subunit
VVVRSKVIWTENNYVEGNDNIAIGAEDYLLSPDGYLMPVKRGQKPRTSDISVRRRSNAA